MEYLIIGIVTLVLFIVIHLRSLSERGIKGLASKRRRKAIKKYFDFDDRTFDVDQGFKRRMKAGGKFYEMYEQLFMFPSIAAGLLKYKKHEWVIIGFEKDQRIDLIWVNKGQNNLGVAPLLSITEIVYKAKKGNYNSVLLFHNHPNSNPNKLRMNEPSNSDLQYSKDLFYVLGHNGINLIEFICERGDFYRYGFSIAPTFLPFVDFRMEVRGANRVSLWGNFKLHMERMV